MRILSLAVTLTLFIIALGLALSNTQMTELRFFLAGDQVLLSLPLVVMLLGFFLIGVTMGMLAGLPSWLRQRRELARLKKQLRSAERARIAEAASSQIAHTAAAQAAGAGLRPSAAPAAAAPVAVGPLQPPPARLGRR